LEVVPIHHRGRGESGPQILVIPQRGFLRKESALFAAGRNLQIPPACGLPE
jgi:hypothetical protein